MAGNIALVESRQTYEATKVAALHDGNTPLYTGAELIARLTGVPDHLKPGQRDV
jgi:hypothetical protein